jgi:predicted GNAT superfamily acetyltransferase
MALDTVADYVAEARVVLQDRFPEYRYSDLELVNALNLGIMSARRMRPDLFLSTKNVVPQFVVEDVLLGTAFAMDIQYRTPFVFFMVGYAQLRDEEDTQDVRAATLIGKFTQQLATLS